MALYNILYIIGTMVLCIGALQVFPIAISFIYHDGSEADIIISCLISLVIGSFLLLSGRRRQRNILTNSEALACVGLCWIAATIAGSFPYICAGVMSPVDAWFESVSGFTTTGSSVLSDIEALPQSLLFWRSFTQWCGGMGIIVLSLAILPQLGVGGMQLYRAEVPGPTPDKLAPRIQDTAKILWGVYCALTAAMIVLLLAFGMNFFDAVNHAFTTLATGGFSTKNTSAASFSPAIQWIIIIFMWLAGINFTLHFRFISGKFNCYRHSEECRFFLLICVVLISLTSVILYANNVFQIHSLHDFEKLIRSSAFQIISLITTTGFASENYNNWPIGIIPIFLFATFIGSCVGSTSGGFKIMRVILIGKIFTREIFSLLHPRGFYTIKFQDTPLSEKIISSTCAFFITSILIIFISTSILVCYNIDLLTSFSATITCLANTGPGFGLVGPVDNFGWMPASIKILLSFCMLAGRLELYALLILLHPAIWKR